MAVQAAPALLDIDKAVEKTIAYIDETDAKGVQLIIFPETWVSGYPCDYDLAIAAAAKHNTLHAIVDLSEKNGGSF